MAGDYKDKLKKFMMSNFSEEDRKRELGSRPDKKENTAISTPKTQMSSHDSFVNPYNFISIDKEVIRKPIEEWQDSNEERLSGWLDLEIETKTPLCIPDTRYADPSSEHKTYGFFSYKDDQVINKEGYKNRSFTAPVIPASEIRGMLRSAFEAVTNSCLSTTDNELLLSKRSSAPLNEYGLLVYEDKEWALFSAEYHKVYESHLGPKFHVHQNKVVWFKEGDSKPLSFEQRPGYREGVLHLTPLGVRSNSQRVFFNLNRKLKGEASDLARAYERTLAKYIDNAHEKACTYYKPLYDKLIQIKKGKCEKAVLPVYYDSNMMYFAPSPITIRVSPNKLKDILKKQNGHQPCSDRDNLCEGCYLFGMTSNENSIATSLRVTDALIHSDFSSHIEDLYLKEHMLQELSNPKISSTEFYLKEPSGMTVDYWDYDKTEPSISSYQAEIRGRKVYWHHQYKRDQKPGGEKRRVTVDLVKDGIRFSYKIYFENLNMKELSRLYWVLTVGQSAEYGHKIGLGKPLGLGSIVISLKDAWVRKLSKGEKGIDYELISVKEKLANYTDHGINSKDQSIREFLRINRINGPDNVSYPLADDGKNRQNSQATFNWFVLNRGNFKKQKFQDKLPLITDNDISLKKKYGN